MTKQKPCPHCGHINLGRANFCFECGTDLTTQNIIQGVKPHHHQLTTTDTPDIAVRSLDTVTATRQSREASKLYNAKLTCLRCGSINEPYTSFCAACGAALMVPDEVYQTIVLGSARTSVGRVRMNNEDSVGLWARNGIVLGLVADGMGGAAAGEVASRLAKEAIQADFTGAARGSENLQELSETELADKLRLAVEHANKALLDQIFDNHALHGMGTTVTLALVRGDRAIIAHIGDSRAYLVNAEHGWIHRLTDDHSFVEALVASGHITQAQAAVHPMRSVLYRALGQSDALGQADLYMRTIKPNDRIILCSDGLSRHIRDEEIAQIAMSTDDPEEITQTLIDMTLERGAEDNVSVVTLMVKHNESPREPEQLKAVPGEQVADDDDEDLFSTGRIDPKALEQARAMVRERREGNTPREEDEQSE